VLSERGEVPVGNTVLVADDDRAIRESLTRALELAGYDVVGVDNGVEALARSHQDGFDALVLDVMMPGLTGLDICRVPRAGGDRTPVLMPTARVDIPDRYLRRRLTAAGAPNLIHTVRGVGYTVRRP
jgi:two-component system response regulator MprA